MRSTGNATTFTRIFAFFICSLATVGLFFATYIPLLMIWNNLGDAMGLSAAESKDVLNIIIYAFLTFGSVIPMYLIYFSEDQMSEVKKFYKDNTKESIDYKLLLREFMKQFGKKELILVLIFMTVQFIAYFVIPLYSGFLCLTTGILYEIFSSFPIIAYILSIIWYLICYLFCLWLKTRKWEKERIDKSQV